MTHAIASARKIERAWKKTCALRGGNSYRRTGWNGNFRGTNFRCAFDGIASLKPLDPFGSEKKKKKDHKYKNNLQG